METNGSVIKDTDWGEAQSVKRLYRSLRPECRLSIHRKGQAQRGAPLCSNSFLKYRFPAVDTKESLFSCTTGILRVINLRTMTQDPFRLDYRELCRQRQLNKTLLIIKQVP